MLFYYLRIYTLMKKYLLISLILIFNAADLSAKTHDSWHLLYANTFGTIRDVSDPDKNYKVTEFKSKSSRDTYINGAKQGKRAWHEKSSIIVWELKYHESYVILIGVKTLDGERNLIYTSGEEGGVLYFGLGESTIDGSWHRIQRDLDADLQLYEPNNSIVEVNAFIVRGSGRVGNIEMLRSSQKIQKKIETPKELFVKKEIASESKHHAPIQDKNLSSNTPPTIELKEGELIYHQLGEPFFDPGATATDSEGEALEVDILGEVNINQINRYVLTYVATDKYGNSTIESRVVMVHQRGQEESHPDTSNKVSLTLPSDEVMDKNGGVGGADEFPLPIEEIELLPPIESMD